MKPKFLLQIDLGGIINFNTFSVVPSIINENAKNALFYFKNVDLSIFNQRNRFQNNFYYKQNQHILDTALPVQIALDCKIALRNRTCK